MRLKTFTAASMPEAMAKVREALGDDAIIISTRKSPRGGIVEIKAAVEHDDGPPPRTPADPFAGAGIEARMQAMLLERLRGARPQRAAAPAFDAALLARALAFHGVPGDAAASLADAAAATRIPDTTLAFAQALDQRLRFEPAVPLPHRPLVLVGMPGSGKTVLAAKIAARALEDGHAVRLVAADAARAGALAQLRTYGELLGCAVAEAPDAATLGSVIDASEMPAVVDTTGINPYDPAECAALADRLGAVSADPVLVMAAGGSAEEAREIAQTFAGLGATRLAVTRLDAARRFGAVIAAADAGLALSISGASPYLGEPLTTFNALNLARLLLEATGIPQESTS